ncbi:MAG TPA: hypothetical protein VL400_20280 [Polyangiaceae bacterium]|jgi:hypothetical protein|nr:hypothetical protein [Polyangiaceae bacterium]
MRLRQVGKVCATVSPLVLALALVQAPSFAQSDADKATARQLGVEGQEALDRKDFKTAEDRYKRADQLFHAPTIALGLARAYAGTGKYVAAQETYNRLIREGAPAGAPPAFQKAVEDAKAEVGAVSAKIGSVVISVTGADSPKVTLDDQPFSTAALGVKRPVDPGTHVVKATADGYKPAEAKFVVSEAGTATASLALEKDPNAVVAPAGSGVPAATPAAAGPQGEQPHPGVDVGTQGGSSNKTIGFVALGVGGVGLVVGAITGIMAIGKHSDLDKACTDGKCTDDKKSDVDSYNTIGTISTVGFIVGGVGVAAGAILLLTAPKEGHAASVSQPLVATPKRPAPSRGFVSPYVGPASVGAIGRF